MNYDVDAVAGSRAWPFEEARKVLARVRRTGQSSALFETGYGPSGLPHVGTFAEVARTAMVRNAFVALTGGEMTTRLVVFSDDMDALRRVPDDAPGREALERGLGLPLTSIPSPYGDGMPSFGAANNARLRAFIDRFGFDYEFVSATERYRSGAFDTALSRMLAVHDEVVAIVAPTLGPDRRATYSPFLPIQPSTGKVLQVAVTGTDIARGTIAYVDPDTGAEVETEVTGGAVKCQWKADWAMRWLALGVDYEMSGKDLTDSVRLAGRISRTLGREPPEGFTYELFLDAEGRKISKSKGNGFPMDEWLAYGGQESLTSYLFAKPREARRLHVGLVPRAVEDYLAALAAYPSQDASSRLSNPAWHVHAGDVPAPEALRPTNQGALVTFAMMLKLAAATNGGGRDALWAMLARYAPGVAADTHPRLDALVDRALAYDDAVMAPARVVRPPDGVERDALSRLEAAFATLPDDASAEAIQAVVYDVGRSVERYQDPGAKTATPGRPGVSNAWFAALYETLFGESKGPRFGAFAEIYGLDATRKMLRDAVDRAEEPGLRA